jgi:uncharacterized membrane protein YfcA
MDLLLVCAAGLFAGTLSGVVGTGSSIILVPILVISFGPQQAVPIMAIAALIANVSVPIRWMIDGIMLVSGITLLWTAFR